ncbi:hypothetical protein BU25DRAFT_473202 [Macroventuria anomochaeta]|uniref:Uncharacterized protein n=1 Tax=Macroventuria anomochaeta TaxID=301207 RepID=A0ACB6RVI7_9PLEO|nr:uncharacterized protein BU25DRAFT_473202 [Macroventuria anomochaeta]KAF2625753.1 hypothetical protein BU25DRAFT_473202 [Macroventuria anomochaeta]
MEGLSGIASVIAVIDISAKIAALCYQYSIAAMSRFGVRALKWPFTSKQVEKIVFDMEGYEHAFTLALQVDQMQVPYLATQDAHTLHRKLDLTALPVAKGASYNCHTEEHNSRCLPNTRTALLHDITSWANDKDGKPIFWLSGMAGTGKSTIARTIAQSFASQGRLGASFFFKKGEGECSNASRFFTTIATDLVTYVQRMLPGIRKVLDEDSGISDRALKDQFEKLVLQPLLEIGQACSQASARVVVIDASDECEREQDIRTTLQLLARTKDIRPVPLRIVVTSRPELHIRLGFKEMSTIEHDIQLFLEHGLGAVRKERMLAADWPATHQILALVELAVPLFIYAATMCRYIGTKGSNPEGYLGKWLYAFREVVGSIVVLESPLSTISLACLLQIPQEEIKCLLDSLHSVHSVPDNERSTHMKLASRCLELMSGLSGLRQDMCSLSGPGVLRSEIDEGTVASSLSPDLQYACRYWINHLKQTMSLMRESSRCVHLLDSLQSLASPSASFVSTFLHDTKRFVLRFQSVLADAPLQIYCSALVFAPEASLVRRTFVDQVPQRVEMLSIREADWDAFTAVAFSPDGQLVASASDDETVRVWETSAGTCRSTLEGHSDEVRAVAFSPDGHLVASASHDEKVRMWETATGTCRSTLEGYSEYISYLTFSSDGKILHSNIDDIPLSSLSIVLSPSWK